MAEGGARATRHLAPGAGSWAMPQALEQAADSLGFEENTEGRRDSPRVQNTAEKILEGQGLFPQLDGPTRSVSQKPCKAWFGEGRTVLTRWNSACANALLPVLPPPGEGRAAQADGRMTE